LTLEETLRISSPERLLRAVALDPKVAPRLRVEALLAMDCPSRAFLQALLRAGMGRRKLPASVVLTATAILKTLSPRKAQ